jgi:glycosyltransferase XagB
MRSTLPKSPKSRTTPRTKPRTRLSNHPGDRWAHLPLTTSILNPHRWRDGDTSPGVTTSAEELRATEAERWANWGAAKHGARIIVTRSQTAWLLLVLAACIVVTAWQAQVVASDGLVFVMGFITAVYLVFGLHKAWLLTRVAGVSGYAPHDAVIPDEALPRYTVLVPVHREREMLPVLVRRLEALDYPTDRLQVLLLVEANDQETQQALAGLTLPAHIEAIIVAPGQPQTKPRALNYGLALAKGEYVVVYDAEDEPEPDQLRKAVAAFAKLPPKVICLQARLDLYNRRQSPLTALFALDYLLWYTMVLPGLTQRSSFIPLGGTSNHFRIEPLRRLGGWDPYNVTEDADLGTRLARARLQVAMLDSATGEEALTRLRPWTLQRSRWLKGYMQTYLVHMRHPLRLLREMGLFGWIDFHLLIGGTVFVLLVNPLMWGLSLVYILGTGTPIDTWIHSLFPPAIYYPGVLCQIIGNFLFIYVIIYASVRYRYYDLTAYVLFMPVYWVFMSVAAWRAFYGLVRRPHHWHKTTHGVSIPLLRPELAQQRRIVDELWLDISAQETSKLVATSEAQTSRLVDTRLVDVSEQKTSRLVDIGAQETSRLVNVREVGSPILSMVLPAYNEERVIEQTVRACLDVLDRHCPSAELIVVDDGSRDRTGEILDQLAAVDARMRVVHHRPNQGYGAALLSGFAAARGNFLCFMDSDGQFDPADLAVLVEAQMRHPGAVVLGYRLRRADPPIRKLNAWGWKKAVRLVLGLRGVRDIDCAFKLLPTKAVQACEVTARGAMVNAELLIKLQRMHLPFQQVPVTHRPRLHGQPTGANLRVIAKAFAELVRVRLRMSGWQPPVVPIAVWPGAENGAENGAQAALAAEQMALLNTAIGDGVAADEPARRRLLSPQAWATLGICVVALAGGVWMLNTAAVDDAEGVYWQSLRALASGHPLFTSVFSSQPPVFLRSVYPFYVAFGQTLAAARLGVVGYALVALFACASAGRAIGGRWTGVIACALLAVNPFFFTAAHTLQSGVPALALALIAVAMAAMSMRDCAQDTVSTEWEAGLALASGVALSLGILADLLVAPALIPVLLYLTTPLWRPRRRSWSARLVPAFSNLAVFAVGFIVTGAAVLLPLHANWGTFYDQVVAPHFASVLAPDQGLAQHLGQLLTGAQSPSVYALASVALLGLLVAVRRRAWAMIPLVVWLLVAGALLILQNLSVPSQLVLVVPPLALVAGMVWPLESARRPATPALNAAQSRWSRISMRVAVVAVVLATLLAVVTAVAYDLVQPASEPAARTQMAQALDAATAPGDLVVTDDQYVAGLAGRSVPAELVDTSDARMLAGSLTAAQVESIIRSDQVRAVLFARGRLDRIPGFRDWVVQHFTEGIYFGGGNALYVSTSNG